MNYQRHYQSLMERSHGRVLDGAREMHHIVPRCLGGTDDKANRAALTPREHFIAHMLLVRMHPSHRGLATAAMLMSAHKTKNSHTYAQAKKRFSTLTKGIVPSIDHREKIAAAHRGRKKAPAHIEKIAATKRGTQLSIEHKQRISESVSSIFSTPEGRAAQVASAHKGWETRRLRKEQQRETQ